MGSLNSGWNLGSAIMCSTRSSLAQKTYWYRYHDNYTLGDSVLVSGAFPVSIPGESVAGSGNNSSVIFLGGLGGGRGTLEARLSQDRVDRNWRMHCNAWGIVGRDSGSSDVISVNSWVNGVHGSSRCCTELGPPSAFKVLRLTWKHLRNILPNCHTSARKGQ